MYGHMSGLLQNHYGTGSAEELRPVIATVEPRHPVSVGLTVNEREAGPSHFDYIYIYLFITVYVHVRTHIIYMCVLYHFTIII